MVSKAALDAIAQREATAAKQRASSSSNILSIEASQKIAWQKIDETKSKFHLFTKGSTLDVTPTFTIDELEVGRVLQRGKCRIVNEIRGMQCNEGLDVSEKDTIHTCAAAVPFIPEQQMEQDKKFIASHCIREDGASRYVIKRLNPESTKDPNIFIQGPVDQATEAMFLSSISHPHIITLRAISARSDGEGSSMLSQNFFFIIDRLIDTLDVRIRKWKSQSKSAKGMISKLTRRSSSRLDDLMETRLRYGYDLMGAIEYLHKNHIVFRNLKPENVGFNVRNDIVLFGFGLAREVHEEDRVSDATWKLTGETGTLRYMAPEVALNKPYGYSADMYSFGIMLWEMLKMEKPFDHIQHKNIHIEMVIQKGARPKVDESWGPALTGFLNSCWHQDLTKRPSAIRASAILKREAAKALGGKDLELNNFRRKSTFVNRDSLVEKRHSLGIASTVNVDSVASKLKEAAIQDGLEKEEQ